MIRRRSFIISGVAAIAAPLAAGLRGLGWVDGKNLVIEFRHAAGNRERLSQFASELVELNVDIIVTFSAGVAAAKQATSTIPIVMQTSQDPVRTGFVASQGKSYRRWQW